MTEAIPETRQYVVVIRGGTRIRIGPDEQLTINVEADGHKIILTFLTRYVNEGFDSDVPRELWIDARGPADSLDNAIVEFTNAANLFTTIISFCVNGYAGKLRFHIAYDNTPDLQQREFFEQFVEDERGAPRPARRVAPQTTLAVVQALARSSDTQRLRRAIMQYVLALQYWSMGEEILTVSHLFMGMEALVPVVRKRLLAEHGVTTNQELASALGIEVEALDGHIRRLHLFGGDEASHRAAKRASDAVEHGFLDYDEIREYSIASRDKTAANLRRAIVEYLGVTEEIRQSLFETPYDKPIRTEGYIRYLRGHLQSEHQNLAPDGLIYPFVDWKFSVTAFRLSDEGKYTMSFSQNLTPRLGEGVTFTPQSLEVYGPEGVKVDPPAKAGQIEPTIVAKQPEYREISGDELASVVKKALQSGGAIEELKIRTPEGELLVIKAERHKPSQEEEAEEKS